MPEARATRVSDRCLKLEGDLTFNQIMAVKVASESLLLKMDNQIEVDFSGVTRTDSSALSFWLCCLRSADSSGRSLIAKAVPEELLDVARLVGLGHYFGETA
ncbi:STAS domain-containing protein [Marinobacterium jannaschii]|uniref:STAS domain-containing protein n=1 Tax=Marinobacterium jannaschii TaxID=64970 RepID=UPI000483C0EA|nr:STAS domain-containing protein [Marinobacterium jannaschii]